jgi:hypothetical protein
MGEGGEKLPPHIAPVGPEVPPPQMGEGGEKLPPGIADRDDDRPPQMGEGGEKLPPTWRPDEDGSTNAHVRGRSGGSNSIAVQSSVNSHATTMASTSLRHKLSGFLGSILHSMRMSGPELNSAPSEAVETQWQQQQQQQPSEGNAPQARVFVFRSAATTSAVARHPTTMNKAQIEPYYAVGQTEPASSWPREDEGQAVAGYEGDSDDDDHSAVANSDEQPMPMPMPMPMPPPGQPHHDSDSEPPHQPRGPRHHHAGEGRSGRCMAKQVRRQLHKVHKHLRKIEALLGREAMAQSLDNLREDLDALQRDYESVHATQFDEDTDVYSKQEWYHRRHGAPKHLLVLMVAGGAAVVCLAALVACCIVRRRRRRENNNKMRRIHDMQQAQTLLTLQQQQQQQQQAANVNLVPMAHPVPVAQATAATPMPYSFTGYHSLANAPPAIAV